MDGPDGQNPTLNNQPMPAEPGRIKKEEGRGAIIIFELTLRGMLPWGAGHNNLEGLKLDDHHGVGCDWTFETNKFRRLRLRHVCAQFGYVATI